MAEIKLKKKDYEAIIKNMSIELDIAKGLLERMKSCENCKNNYFLATEEPCYSCTRCYARTTKKTTDNWELAND